VQEKRVLVRQDVACRSDFARERQTLAQATGLSKAAPVPKRREIDSNERQSVDRRGLPDLLLIHIALHFETDLEFDITGNAARVGYLVTLFFLLGAYCVHFV
jgi:hypothetical protein